MRNIININACRKFIREDAGLPAAFPADWADVNLPHTWNAVDGNDGNEGAANWFTAMGDNDGQRSRKRPEVSEQAAVRI